MTSARPSFIGRKKSVLLLTPHGELSFILHGGGGSHAGRALDRRGVDAAVYYAPRRVVMLTQLDRTPHLPAADLIHAQAGDPQELASFGHGLGSKVLFRHGLLLRAVVRERTGTS